MMILILNGPNLNLLGTREPEIYGRRPFLSFLESLRSEFPEHDVHYLQTNSEGGIIDAIQKYGLSGECRGIILNPGGYTHYSIAIADAIGAVPVPVVEVHVSNILGREECRRRSVTAGKAAGVIAGLGLDGYRLALLWLTSNSRP